MQLDRYNPERDRDAVLRVFREVGWLDPKSEEQIQQFDLFLASGLGWVARLDGEAEAIAVDSAGVMQHGEAELPLAGVTGVCTSPFARKRGLATQVVARLIADEAEKGFALSALGVFDQGFYDRLGYGAGTYDHYVEFDPRQLTVPVCRRTPCRISKDDWQDVHTARLRRRKHHGAVTFHDPGFTRAEMLETKNGFGMGFRDDADGGLSHFFWCAPENVEHGPYRLRWLVWQTGEQLRELLGLVKGLEEQIHLASLCEPADIQMHDLLSRPHANKATAIKSRMDWEIRICDVQACLSATRLACAPLSFGLELTDPVADHLPTDASWRGVGGSYVVTLGPTCTAEPGSAPGLPMLEATINAFTRLWLGVKPASGLAITDRLEAPPDLLRQLDAAFCLPVPRWDWRF